MAKTRTQRKTKQIELTTEMAAATTHEMQWRHRHKKPPCWRYT